ncbi:unnamed protein product [Discosporangium mesarthrocarpum]
MTEALGELRCKINPGPRTHFVGAYFKQKIMLIGGRAGANEVSQDAWYRDDRIPTAYIEEAPSSGTSGR